VCKFFTNGAKMKNPDKQSIQNFCNDFDSFISGMADPKFKTKQAKAAYFLLIASIKLALFRFGETDLDER